MQLHRSLFPTVLESLAAFPVVALVGPRQVGKTSLARQVESQWQQAGRPVVMLDLELPSDLGKLAEPELFLGPLADHLVILDEVQLRPDLFPVLRALVDMARRPGRFLVLGSAAPALMRQSSETLAGRIEFLELAPFSLVEVFASGVTPGPPTDVQPTDAQRRAREGVAAGGTDVADVPGVIRTLWQRGGFPESFLAPNDAGSLRWREAFIRSYLERDIPQLGIRVSAATLRRFWLMLAHRHGQVWNASTIAGSLGISAPSVRSYLDILESTFMVRVLQPYSANLGKRLVKSPKVYLRDSGLLHALLNVTDYQGLAGHPVVGASWEGWVIEQILSCTPEGTRPTYYRTATGNEIDLLLELPGGQLRAIEIKHSAAPTLSRGLAESLDALGLESGYVVAPVAEAYPIRRARVLPVREVGRIWGD